MAVINFKRVEKKYVLSPEQYNAVLSALSGCMAADEYGWSQVTSLYYDTPYHEIIARSMEKPLYKEKLRLRTYEGLHAQSQVFVELKKKYKGIVYKRRVTMSHQAAQKFVAGMDYRRAVAMYPLANPEEQERATSAYALQIAREIQAAFRRYPNIRESMVITCNRCAYVPSLYGSMQGSDLRITFDANIGFQSMMSPCGGSLLAPGQVLMEIKTAKAYPLWLTHVLSANQIRPVSFSKYGRAYQQEMELVRSGAASFYVAAESDDFARDNIYGEEDIRVDDEKYYRGKHASHRIDSGITGYAI